MPKSSASHLERYELLDRIAVGGMAEVYRAKAYGDHGFEKELAIKRILPELARDPEFEQRFIGEAKLAVKLSHANVVQVLDFGRFSGTLFIAMEYVHGLDLAALLKVYRERGDRIPLPAAFHISVEIARGLDFAHQHGVIHRDVSPSNILLSRAGEVKIADFGIAQAVSTKADKLGRRRRIMGKWRYMSPEQTRGENLSTQSDLFSAASVIFEVFTGEKLFPGDEADEIIENIRGMELPKPSDRRTGLSPRLDKLLAKALERRPSDRWQSSTDMLRALIEVSYESSMVATALDVADVVKDALEGADQPERRPSKGIDALIRQQVGAALAASDARRTAVGDPELETADEGELEVAAPDAVDEFEATGSQSGVTVVRKGVDGDGITLWEFDDATIAAGPVAIRTGKRTTGAGDLYGRPNDPDSGAIATNRKRPVGLIVGTVLAIVAIAVVGTLSSRSENANRRDVVAPTKIVDIDAAVQPAHQATLDVDSSPQGAQVRVDGILIPGATPLKTTLSPLVPHRIEIARDGYQTVVDEALVLQPGERLRIVPPLTRLTATLEVIGRPEGATVVLAGEPIGVTPLLRQDLAPGRGLQLVIQKPDYHSYTTQVDLRHGERTVVKQSLASSLRFGSINLQVRTHDGERAWGAVYFKGKMIGQAPETFRLPVGKHRLRVVNPATKKVGYVTVTVKPDGVGTFEVRL